MHPNASGAQRTPPSRSRPGSAPATTLRPAEARTWRPYSSAGPTKARSGPGTGWATSAATERASASPPTKRPEAATAGGSARTEASPGSNPPAATTARPPHRPGASPPRSRGARSGPSGWPDRRRRRLRRLRRAARRGPPGRGGGGGRVRVAGAGPRLLGRDGARAEAARPHRERPAAQRASSSSPAPPLRATSRWRPPGKPAPAPAPPPRRRWGERHLGGGMVGRRTDVDPSCRSRPASVDASAPGREAPERSSRGEAPPAWECRPDPVPARFPRPNPRPAPVDGREALGGFRPPQGARAPPGDLAPGLAGARVRERPATT